MIYRIYNELNGMSYVGKSKDPEARIRHHFSLLKRGIHCSKFQIDYDQDGEIHFKCEILDQDDRKEDEWIQFYKSHSLSYNKISGGGGGTEKSEETRKLMSQVRKGKLKSELWKKRISEGLKKYWNNGKQSRFETISSL